MNLGHDPLNGFPSFEAAVAYRVAYGDAYRRREREVMAGRVVNGEALARRLLAGLPEGADEFTRRGVRDGATGARPTW